MSQNGQIEKDFYTLWSKTIPSESQLIALGGSLSLYKLGLLKRKCKDIDIVVSEKAKHFITVVKSLRKLFPVGKTELYYYPDPSVGKKSLVEYIRFNFKGYDVCVFIVTHDFFTQSTFGMPGHHYPVIHPSVVVSAKQDYIKGAKKITPAIRKHMNDLNEILSNLLLNYKL